MTKFILDKTLMETVYNEMLIKFDFTMIDTNAIFKWFKLLLTSTSVTSLCIFGLI
jgi:hypothetical protein